MHYILNFKAGQKFKVLISLKKKVDFNYIAFDMTLNY